MITADVKNLDYYYGKNKYLFKDLTFQLPGGKICGLLGKNGAGKTTLLKLLTGLTFKKNGVLKVIGFDPERRLPEFLRDVYLLPEEFDTPKVTIKKYVALYAPLYPSFDHALMAHALMEFELLENYKLHQISLGQKKKAMIAFALASRCKILLLDEPTNGLDIPSKSTFRKLVASSIQDDQTMLISTHQVRDLDSLIDQVIILNEGKIVFNQDTERISNNYLFKHQVAKTDFKNILYEEDGFHYSAFIAKNENGIPTKIDFELLFNGILAFPEKFTTN